MYAPQGGLRARGQGLNPPPQGGTAQWGQPQQQQPDQWQPQQHAQQPASNYPPGGSSSPTSAYQSTPEPAYDAPPPVHTDLFGPGPSSPTHSRQTKKSSGSSWLKYLLLFLALLAVVAVGYVVFSGSTPSRTIRVVSSTPPPNDRAVGVGSSVHHSDPTPSEQQPEDDAAGSEPDQPNEPAVHEPAADEHPAHDYDEGPQIDGMFSRVCQGCSCR